MAPPRNAQSGAKPAKDAQTPEAAKRNSSEASLTRLLDALLSLLIPGLILVHLVVAPYTKVEESFNIQAAHDVLVYGTPTSDIHHKLSTTYDHFTFPGAVPRTFIGPVLLAGLAQPVVALVGFQHAQLVVRAILGLFNATCLLVFALNLRRAYGAGTARWYLLLQASQFHIMFYASRALPNMFAFGLTTLAFAFLLPQPGNPKSTTRRQRLSITMFVFAAAIFRSEVALLMGTTILHALLVPELSVERVLFPFATSFIIALATSIPIDSYFWQRPLWPELWGFYYNVVQGSASNWGVSPWHYYFSSALPRLFINPLTYTALIPFSLWHPALRRAASRLVVPSLLFTAIYSLQPHKETRFIFYAIPPLTAAAALSANFLAKRRSKSPLFFLITAILLLSVLASFAASTAMLLLSSLNYPGGEALSHLRATILSSPAATTTTPSHDDNIVLVHADVLSCMTGVTLFGTSTASSAADAIPRLLSLPVALPDPETVLGNKEDSGPIRVNHQQQTHEKQHHQHQQEPNHPEQGRSAHVQIALDKTESPALLASPAFYDQFTYLLTESPAAALPAPHEWETVGVVKGYAGIEVVKPGQDHNSKEEEGSTDGSSSVGVDADADALVVGRGRIVAACKRRVRALTGGWWVGPRMVERVYILRRRGAGGAGVGAEAGEREREAEGGNRRWGTAVEAR